jgi:hypothetical protein
MQHSIRLSVTKRAGTLLSTIAKPMGRQRRKKRYCLNVSVNKLTMKWDYTV